jgi:hypothetical protein
MVPTKFALLVVSLLPAVSAATRAGDPVVVACLKSETFVRGGVLLSGKQAATQIFDSIGVKLLWSWQDQRDAIVIRLVAHAPSHFRKGTLA